MGGERAERESRLFISTEATTAFTEATAFTATAFTATAFALIQSPLIQNARPRALWLRGQRNLEITVVLTLLHLGW
jgi:hypothetical protein